MTSKTTFTIILRNQLSLSLTTPIDFSKHSFLYPRFLLGQFNILFVSNLQSEFFFCFLWLWASSYWRSNFPSNIYMLIMYVLPISTTLNMWSSNLFITSISRCIIMSFDYINLINDLCCYVYFYLVVFLGAFIIYRRHMIMHCWNMWSLT